MSLRTTSPFTYEDFVHFPDDGQRYELVDGEVYVTPAPSTRHQDVVLRVVRAIADHLDRLGGGRVFVGPVDIVLSDPHHDRVRKRRLYARFGVPEYWIVDPDRARVEVHRLPEGADQYSGPTILEPGATLTTDLLPGLEIDVADLLAEAG